MTQGSGPPVVRDWLERQGVTTIFLNDWTSDDEMRAWMLALRLAEDLDLIRQQKNATEVFGPAPTAGGSDRSNQNAAP
ncbi:hypothetical protein VT84_06580 [Gemmata sp. SH-PL17]|nr:hypothetical protein VT84_06580 [Gemmata sp. SH-PL17]